MFKKSKRILSMFVCAAIIASSLVSVFAHTDTEARQIKNVIYMIPDGAGMAPFFLAEYVSRQGGFSVEKYPDITRSEENRMYIYDYLVGAETTHSASSRVTDSAAGGTALAGGYKTDNGMIGISNDLKPHATILEACQYIGMSTGVVVTHALPDATPAAFSSHADSRKTQVDIGEQEVYQGTDVLISCASDSYKNQKWYSDSLLNSLGYKVITKKDQLGTVQSGDKVFAKIPDLYYEIDRASETPNLAELTDVAIRALDDGNENGFFLMVEGSAIDGGGHDSSAVKMASEWIAFDAACKVAIEYAKSRNDTMVMILPDHDTGGLTVTADDYTKESLLSIVEQVKEGTDPEKLPWEGWMTEDENKRRSHTGRNGGIFMYLPAGVAYPEGIDPEKASLVAEEFAKDFTTCETNRIDNTRIAPYIANLLGVNLTEITKKLFIDTTDYGVYDEASGVFTMTSKSGSVAKIEKNKSVATVDGKEVDLDGQVAVYLGEKFYAPAVLFEYMEVGEAGMKIYADYNTKTVTVEGVTGQGLSDIAVVVTEPGKTVSESMGSDGYASFPYIGQIKSAPWGEYSLEFGIAEGKIGDYKYHTRINNGDKIETHTFSFKDMVITKNGNPVSDISQISAGDTLELVLSGYDFSYDGMAVIAQYDKDRKLVSVAYKDIRGSAVNYEDSTSFDTVVSPDVEFIKGFYWEKNTIAPFSGEYVID